MDKLLPFPEKDAELYSIYAELGELYDLKTRVEQLIQHHTQKIDELKAERAELLYSLQKGGRQVNEAYPLPPEPFQYATSDKINEMMERLQLETLSEPLIKDVDTHTSGSVPE